jgi:hypothetical protein
MLKKRSDLRTISCLLSASLVYLALSTLSTQAQTSSSLIGIVTDQTGAVIPNAKVTIKNESTGQILSTVTDAVGAYRFLNLPLATYDIKVQSLGFKEETENGIQVRAGAALSVNLTLKVGIETGASVQSPGPGIALTSRGFLPDDAKEEPGFGLYSYILFGEPPSDATRERYLAVLTSFLNLPQSREVRKTLPLQQLNVTLVPIRGSDEPSSADVLLRSYDYARAAALLTKINCGNGEIPCGPHLGGPYIISTTIPLSGLDTVSGHFLYQDLSAVPARIVPLWTDEFLKQASQPEFWKKRNGTQAALKLRTAIAVMGDSLTPTEAAAASFKKALATVVWHK